MIVVISRYNGNVGDIGHELRSISSGQLGREPTLADMEDPHRGIAGRRLYVIQVRGRGHQSPFGGLYVGQTRQGRHARLKAHHSGGPTGAKGLAGNCVRLRPELYAHLGLMPDDEAIAMRGEYALAQQLLTRDLRSKPMAATTHPVHLMLASYSPRQTSDGSRFRSAESS